MALPGNHRVASDGYAVPRCELRAELLARNLKRGGEQVVSKSLFKQEPDFPNPARLEWLAGFFAVQTNQGDKSTRLKT